MSHIDTAQGFSWIFSKQKPCDSHEAKWESYSLDKKVEIACDELAKYGRNADSIIKMRYLTIILAAFIMPMVLTMTTISIVGAIVNDNYNLTTLLIGATFGIGGIAALCYSLVAFVTAMRDLHHTRPIHQYLRELRLHIEKVYGIMSSPETINDGRVEFSPMPGGYVAHFYAYADQQISLYSIAPNMTVSINVSPRLAESLLNYTRCNIMGHAVGVNLITKKATTASP